MTRLDEFRPLPGAIEGMARLAACGFALVVVSNQRGVARGLVQENVLREIERELQAALRRHGAEIVGFHYCPHDLDDPRCECRKPKPGMLLAAAREHGLDLARSWMVGDSDSDVEAGEAAGCRTAYVGPGKPSATTTLVAPSLGEAAKLICARA